MSCGYNSLSEVDREERRPSRHDRVVVHALLADENDAVLEPYGENGLQVGSCRPV